MDKTSSTTEVDRKRVEDLYVSKAVSKRGDTSHGGYPRWTTTAIATASGGPSLLGRDWLRQMRMDWQTIHEIRTQPSEAEVKQHLNKH